MSAGGLLMAVLAQAGGLGSGLVLLGAGVSHWRHRALLPGVIANYRLVPDGVVRAVALGLPVVECALGAGLIVSPFFASVALVSGLAAGALLLLFAAAMAINLRRGRGHIDCGCGHAALRQPLSWLLVARNLVLALPTLALALVWLPLGGMDLGSALAGGLAFCLGYHLCNALAALIAGPLSPTLLPLRR